MIFLNCKIFWISIIDKWNFIFLQNVLVFFCFFFFGKQYTIFGLKLVTHSWHMERVREVSLLFSFILPNRSVVTTKYQNASTARKRDVTNATFTLSVRQFRFANHFWSRHIHIPQRNDAKIITQRQDCTVRVQRKPCKEVRAISHIKSMQNGASAFHGFLYCIWLFQKPPLPTDQIIPAGLLK